jgi:hypothetical protein
VGAGVSVGVEAEAEEEEEFGVLGGAAEAPTCPDEDKDAVE